LDWPGLDQIGPDAADHPFQVCQQTRPILQPHWPISAAPLHLFDFRRQRAVFQLVPLAFQAQVVDLMLGLRQGGKEAVVVGGVSRVKYKMRVMNQVSGFMCHVSRIMWQMWRFGWLMKGVF
jgi:hypothetical protein